MRRLPLLLLSVALLAAPNDFPIRGLHCSAPQPGEVAACAQFIRDTLARPIFVRQRVTLLGSANWSRKIGRERVRMNIRPLHDRVLVKRLEEAETKIGGIIVPDTAKEKPQQGQVMGVGNGKLLETGERIPLDVKVGDRVLFGKYSGSDIRMGDEEYLILREDEILAVLS